MSESESSGYFAYLFNREIILKKLAEQGLLPQINWTG